MPDEASADPPAQKSVPAPRDPHLRDMANCIRFLAMDAVQNAKSGHPGAPMGMADIATVLLRISCSSMPRIRTGSTGIDLSYPTATVRCCCTACYF